MIQRVIGIVFIFSSGFLINTRADTKAEANRLDPQLEGVWVLKSMQRGGMTVEGVGMPVRMRGTKRTIKGNQMTLARGGGDRQYKFTFTVDTSTKPKQMDISAERNGKVRVLKCICEVKGNILRIAETDTERPKTFTTDRSSTRKLVSMYAKERKES